MRVAELGGIEAGPRTIQVILRDADGEVVLERSERTDIRERTAITLVLTRTCRGVTCPAPGGAAEETECFGGRCVSPDCTDEDRTTCGPAECTVASDCSSMGSACASARCEDTSCFYVLDGSRCAPGERCQFSAGCVGGTDAGIVDASMPDAGTDAGPSDAGPRDAGPPDTGPSDAGPSDAGPPDAAVCPGGCFLAGCQPGDSAAACGVSGGACVSCAPGKTCGGGGLPGVCGIPACFAGAGSCANPERLCDTLPSVMRSTCTGNDTTAISCGGVAAEEYVFLFCEGLFFTSITSGYRLELRQSDGTTTSCPGSALACGPAGIGHDRTCIGPDHGTYAIVQRQDGTCGSFTLDMSPL